MQTLIHDQDSNCGGRIIQRNDGTGFQVIFLYNMSNSTHLGTDGDVYYIRSYKTEKTAHRKIAAFVAIMRRTGGDQ